MERRLSCAICADRCLWSSDAARARSRKIATTEGQNNFQTRLAYNRPLDFYIGGAVGTPCGSYRLYLNRHRSSPFALGHSAVLVSADLGACVPAPIANFAQKDAADATDRHRGNRASVFLCGLDPAAGQSHRSPCRFLRHRHGLSRRARTDAPGPRASDHLLRFAGIWRHARWTLCRIGRAVRFFVGGGVSDPRRARHLVPAIRPGNLETARPLALVDGSLALAAMLSFVRRR